METNAIINWKQMFGNVIYKADLNAKDIDWVYALLGWKIGRTNRNK